MQKQRRRTCAEASVTNPVRTVIVDDDAAFCQVLRGWFENAGDILIAGQTPGAPDILERLRELQPDVILLDLAAAPPAQIRAMTALAPIIILHVTGQESLVIEALRAGALGHLDKRNTPPSQVIAAIRAVQRGEAVLSPALAGRILDEVAMEQRRKLTNNQSIEKEELK